MKRLLLIEDNEEDILFTLKACEDAPSAPEIEVLRDGQAALDYLSGAGCYADKKRYPPPDLILLDIKLPRKHGFEVLEWIRSQPTYKSLPVIMLTGSDLPQDIARAYKLNATSYLRKQSNPEAFRHAVQLLLAYWLEVNIPSNHYSSSF